MLSHQFFEDIIPRQKSESLAEVCAAAKAGELALIGEASRSKFVHSEKISELGMLAIENRA